MKRRFHIDTPMMLLLFCIFASCIMMVLIMGAKTYQGVVERDAAALDSRTAQQYLSAKLRRQDGSDVRPHVMDLDGNYGTKGPALEFVEEIEGMDYRTVIYCMDGHVYELFTLADLPFEAGEGEYVLDAASLAFEDTGKGIRVVMTSVDGNVYDFYVGFLSAAKGGHGE